MSKQTRLFACLVIALLGLSACQQALYSDKAAPQAIRGVLDLHDWDLAHDGAVSLAGEWACSAQKAAQQLGFSVAASLPDRLRQTARWYRQEGWL